MVSDVFVSSLFINVFMAEGTLEIYTTSGKSQLHIFIYKSKCISLKVISWMLHSPCVSRDARL